MMHEGYKFFFRNFLTVSTAHRNCTFLSFAVVHRTDLFSHVYIVLSLSNSAISNKEYDRYFLFQLFELYFMYLTQKDYIQ